MVPLSSKTYEIHTKLSIAGSSEGIFYYFYIPGRGDQSPHPPVQYSSIHKTSTFNLNIPDLLEAEVALVRWGPCHKVGSPEWADLQVDCTSYSWSTRDGKFNVEQL